LSILLLLSSMSNKLLVVIYELNERCNIVCT
jgi:hypothetical protein